MKKSIKALALLTALLLCVSAACAEEPEGLADHVRELAGRLCANAG